MGTIRTLDLGRLATFFAALLLAVSAPAVAADGSAPTVLITGSNRGIGLEFTRQYAALGWRVVATCRDPAHATKLQDIAARKPNVVIERMDITDPGQVTALASRYRGQPIDVLINNAAFLGPRLEQEFGALDWDLFASSFATNAVGPMRVTQALADNVAASQRKRVLTLSSAAGSIEALNRGPTHFYQYRASKAALNMLMRGAALDLAPRGIVVGLVNPGLVDTRGIMALKPGEPVPDEFVPLMPLIRSGALKLITPAESVAAMIKLVDGLRPEDAGRFLNYDGTTMPW